MLNKTVRICNAGDHLSFKISRQIRPSLSILGWYSFVKKRTFGGAMGYSAGKNSSSLKIPPIERERDDKTGKDENMCIIYIYINTFIGR